MRRKSIIILFVFFYAVTLSNVVSAEDLAFPSSTEEIVKALSFKKATVTYDGQQYVSNEDGEVFIMVNGKKFRMKGIKNIPRKGLLPRVGALITFDYNSSNIKESSYKLLDRYGKVFTSELADAKFIVEGHTDNVGSDVYNLQLSQKRSESVKRYLASNYNIAEDRLLVKGAGEYYPIADNATDKGRAMNRRVEFVRIIE